MKTTIFSLCCLFLIAVCSCTKQNSLGNRPNYIHKEALQGNGFTFYTDNASYDAALQQRNSNNSGQPFGIEAVKRNGDILTITVSYASTCTAPQFSVIWNGEVLLTYLIWLTWR